MEGESRGCRQVVSVAWFPHERRLVTFSWHIIPRTDVPTQLQEHAVVFFQPTFTAKHNLGLCQDKRWKMDSQAPISQRCGFMKKVHGNRNTEKRALWKTIRHAGWVGGGKDRHAPSLFGFWIPRDFFFSKEIFGISLSSSVNAGNGIK